MDNDLISRQAAIKAVEFEITYIHAINIETGEVTDLSATANHKLEKAITRIKNIPSAERRGRWTIEAVHQYELAYGTTAYEPVYKCSCCGLVTESYLRLDEPIMPDDADFPKWCGNCGARMEVE